MMTVYDIEINNQAVLDNLQKLQGLIFKLLPMREEGQEWEKTLETIIVEVLGMTSLFDNQKDLLALSCKLEGLHAGGEEIDFFLYRRTIFEACCLVNKLQEQLV